MTQTVVWIVACNADDIEEEDVLRFDRGEKSYAIYRIEQGFFASDGHCTHEDAHLADGFVLGDQIECPRHQGRFHIPSGKPLCAPVCKHLKLHPTRVENGRVMIGLEDEA